jgi:N-acetylglucosaminyldiphosphoundecaprenol N-acetyl-beta-D-mannosaminyltransferase
MSAARPFGLRLSTESAYNIARMAVAGPPPDGVALVVTPNIDHIAKLRRSAALAAAYRGAAHIVCDGWPVQLYARLQGLAVSRVTGCAITSELMGMLPYLVHHRLFIVVDNAATERAVFAWARLNDLFVDVAVPPFGFDRDAVYCGRLADAIKRYGTTVLIMAVGAPRSEIFVDSHRSTLPPCWAFCVGQAVKIELGLVRRASRRWQLVGMEWLWRLTQEPSRLARRYMSASVGFGLAVIEDQLRLLRERSL